MKEEANYNDSNSDDDSEDEDDLADVPDTREYMPLDLQGLQSIGIGSGMSGKGGSGEDGQYTMKDLQAMTMNTEDINDDESEEDEDEINDTKLLPTDALLVIAKTEEDYASLEINIFDTESSNLYVHHDIPLPSYPLCLALGSVVSSYYRPESNDGNNGSSGGGVSSGNFVAVGSFEPGIEIWNLDVMNALEPTVVLGGMDTRGTEDDWMGMSAGKKKKKNKGGGGGLRKGSHTDAIMGLSWNTVHQQVLASGSADGTVKLWDVTQCKGDYIEPSATLTHHTDKVQSLAWHPNEGTLLATGGYDRQVCLVDARSAASVASNNSSNANVKKAKLLADCEAIAWDVHNQQYLTAASEDGVIQCWDVRKFGSDPVWSFVAHEYGVSDFCYNSQVPGMLITCSIDKTVALWDTRKSTPEPCGSKEMNVGKLYSVRTYPSSPWLLACGGSGNELAIWDMEGEDAIQRRFAKGSNEDSNTEAAAADQEEPDFEAIMANNDATSKEKDTNNSKKKKKKKGKAHKRK